MYLKSLRKGCGIFIVVFAAFVFVYQVTFSMLGQRAYLRAGVADKSFLLSLLAALFMSLSVLSLWGVLHTIKELRSLDDTSWQLAFREGEKVFLCGRIYPLHHIAVKSPFTERECVLYEYEISGESRSEETKQYWGARLIPSVIRTRRGEYALLSRPQLQGFEKRVLRDSFAQQRAAAYVASATFQTSEISGNFKQKLYEYMKEYEERDGSVSIDNKQGDAEINAASEMSETIVETGQEVCLSGLWSGEQRTVVADISRNVYLMLYQGGAGEVKRLLTKRAIGNALFGLLCGIGVNLGIIYFLTKNLWP